jgi:molybdopterin synthase catalytic subunit
VLSLDALVRETASPDAGALVIFAGTVRRTNDGREVTALEYSVYAPLAERRLSEIEAEAERRFNATACRIRHRVGPLAIGETSVLIVARAPHRTEAFAAARYAIDTVKHDVPIWKRETYADGSEAFVKGCALHSTPDEISL